MDKIYPMWREKSVVDTDYKYDLNNRILQMKLRNRESLRLEKLLSIPIYHLNNAALDDDWDSFLMIVSYHGYRIVPAALLMCHCFKRFDLSKRLIERYSFEKLIPLVHEIDNDDIYIWTGGIYRYPLLY